MWVRHVIILGSILLMLGATVAQAGGDVPRQGLMWNRTGLPAVFPLQVKTRPGQNYVLLLSDAQTNEDVLAAYISGVPFFAYWSHRGHFACAWPLGSHGAGRKRCLGARGRPKLSNCPRY